jgi:hypothetical protein
MKRWWVGVLLVLSGFTVQAADPCAGKVAAGILAYDRDTRQGVGLLLNYCGRPVKAELLVSATNLSGFVVARLRTGLQASAETLSVITVDLPFVQSAVMLSGYDAEVATIEALDVAVEHTAALDPASELDTGRLSRAPYPSPAILPP